MIRIMSRSIATQDELAIVKKAKAEREESQFIYECAGLMNGMALHLTTFNILKAGPRGVAIRCQFVLGRTW